MKKIAVIATLLLGLAVAAQAQEDWANFSRYNEANKSVTQKPLAVLMGDSITDVWASHEPQFFADNNLVGRGISGQCTAQMLVRFRRDVVDLAPKYVAILAGINDLAQNAGFTPEVDDIFGNIVSMCEIARANGIQPVLCTLTPGATIPWRDNMPVADKVDRLNKLITDYAAAQQLPLVDYFTPFAGPQREFPKVHSYDGIHPTDSCYKIMEEILLQVLNR